MLHVCNQVFDISNRMITLHTVFTIFNIPEGSVAPMTEKPSIEPEEVPTVDSNTKLSNTQPSEEPNLEPSEQPSMQPTEDLSGDSSGESSGGGEITVEPSTEPNEGSTVEANDVAAKESNTAPSGEPSLEFNLEPGDFSNIHPSKESYEDKIIQTTMVSLLQPTTGTE